MSSWRMCNQWVREGPTMGQQEKFSEVVKHIMVEGRDNEELNACGMGMAAVISNQKPFVVMYRSAIFHGSTTRSPAPKTQDDGAT